MHLFILINNASGTSSKKQFLEQLKQDCADQHWSYEVHSSRWINTPSNVHKVLKEKHPTLLICGGDGTVNKVMKSLWKQHALSKVRLVLYPGGTFNALSKASGWLHKNESMIIPALKKGEELHADVFEITRSKGKKSITDILQTGVLFVKNSDFTLHAAQIRKALHHGDLSLGFGSIKKALPYLEKIHTFHYLQSKKEQIAQALYLANNPYLITNTPIHSKIEIDDGKLDHFLAREADYFQIGQSAAVLLLGNEKDLPFLEWKQLRTWQMQVQERVHMNLDGDTVTLEKGTEVEIHKSDQYARLIQVHQN